MRVWFKHVGYVLLFVFLHQTYTCKQTICGLAHAWVVRFLHVSLAYAEETCNMQTSTQKLEQLKGFQSACLTIQQKHSGVWPSAWKARVPKPIRVDDHPHCVSVGWFSGPWRLHNLAQDVMSQAFVMFFVFDIYSLWIVYMLKDQDVLGSQEGRLWVAQVRLAQATWKACWSPSGTGASRFFCKCSVSCLYFCFAVLCCDLLHVDLASKGASQSLDRCNSWAWCRKSWSLLMLMLWGFSQSSSWAHLCCQCPANSTTRMQQGLSNQVFILGFVSVVPPRVGIPVLPTIALRNNANLFHSSCNIEGRIHSLREENCGLNLWF